MHQWIQPEPMRGTPSMETFTQVAELQGQRTRGLGKRCRLTHQPPQLRRRHTGQLWSCSGDSGATHPVADLNFSPIPRGRWWGGCHVGRPREPPEGEPTTPPHTRGEMPIVQWSHRWRSHHWSRALQNGRAITHCAIDCQNPASIRVPVAFPHKEVRQCSTTDRQATRRLSQHRFTH